MKRLLILAIVLFTAIGAYVVNLPPREMTLKDLHPVYIPHKPQAEIPLSDTTETDSTRRLDNIKAGSGLKSTSRSASASTSIHISVLPNLVKTPVNTGIKSDSDLTSIDKPKTYPKSKSKSDSVVDYYIIVGGHKDLKTAQQKAEMLKKQFNTDFLVLPPTKEGYFRVSCGKYATLEEARAALNSVRTTIRDDVWILSSSAAVPAAL